MHIQGGRVVIDGLVGMGRVYGRRIGVYSITGRCIHSPCCTKYRHGKAIRYCNNYLSLMICLWYI